MDTQGVTRGTLTIHADRGTSTTSKGVAELLTDLGVARTHSRPHVSNDNPYSEAVNKTLKYSPAFPERFGSIEDARAFCADFFEYYNHHHRHSGIGLGCTPRHRSTTARPRRSGPRGPRPSMRPTQSTPAGSGTGGPAHPSCQRQRGLNRPGESGDSTLMDTMLLHCRHDCNSKPPPISPAECRRSTRRAACC